MPKQFNIPTSGEMHHDNHVRETIEALAFHKGMHEHYRQRFEELYEELASGRQAHITIGHRDRIAVRKIAEVPT